MHHTLRHFPVLGDIPYDEREVINYELKLCQGSECIS